jgi:LemA protein
VLKVASELYAEAQNSYAVEDLKAAGEGVNIPPEIIEQAIAQVQEQRRQEAVEREKTQAKNQKLKLVGAGVGTLALLWGILAFNAMSRANQQVNSAWAQVENVLQRRADLIPQLLKVTKAQSKNEKDVIKLLLSSQKAFENAKTNEDKLKASQSIDRALKDFDKVVKPADLDSSQAYLNLQYEIAGSVNRITKAKKDYISAVKIYNQAVTSFPNSIVANVTGMKPVEFSQINKN